jgi:hypothetical protein
MLAGWKTLVSQNNIFIINLSKDKRPERQLNRPVDEYIRDAETGGSLV